MTESRLAVLKIRRAFLIESLVEARLQFDENPEELEALELWVRELTKAIEITSSVDSLRKATKNRRWFKQ